MQEKEKTLTTNCLIRDKLTAQVRRCVLTVTFHRDNGDDEDKKKTKQLGVSHFIFSLSLSPVD